MSEVLRFCQEEQIRTPHIMHIIKLHKNEYRVYVCQQCGFPTIEDGATIEAPLYWWER